VTLDHRTVGGTNLVRKDDQHVADGDLTQADVGHPGEGLAVSHARHAPGQSFQHRRCASLGQAFERGSAGKHQDDDIGHQILAQERRRDDGNTGQQVAAEIPGPNFTKQREDQRDATDRQRRQKRNILRLALVGESQD
jgi:hypothetical protein